MLTSTSVHDPQAEAHKKARRNFYRSTKQRPPESSYHWTAFRAAEKKYKAKFPPPDLSNVLDLTLLQSIDGDADDVALGVWKGSPTAHAVTPVHLKAHGYGAAGKERKAYIFPQIPGTVAVPRCRHQLMPSYRACRSSWVPLRRKPA